MMATVNDSDSSELENLRRSQRIASILPDLDRAQAAFRQAKENKLADNMPSSSYPPHSNMLDSSQGDTFTLFSLLPKELRIQIWNYALSPRIISFHRDRNRGRYVGARAVKFMALTTFNPSLETIPRVCAESLAIFQKKYMDWDVWDVRKGISTTKFDPDHDVVYFAHGFAGNIDLKLLDEFASQYPIPTKRIKTLALPAVLSSDAVSGVEILKSLRLFQSLNKLIIVLGHTYGPGLEGNTQALNFSWSMLWNERSEDGKGVWNLPDGAQDALETLQKEQWPDWRIPKVSIAKFLDEVLQV